MDRHTEGKCRVCQGEIVEKIVSESIPRTGPVIYGPGSGRKLRDVSKGYHCVECGLKYEFVPVPVKKSDARKSGFESPR